MAVTVTSLTRYLKNAERLGTWRLTRQQVQRVVRFYQPYDTTTIRELTPMIVQAQQQIPGSRFNGTALTFKLKVWSPRPVTADTQW